jgi:tryptophan synthase
MCLEFVKEARSKGLKAPVILMGASCSSRDETDLANSRLIANRTGYFNPLLAYTEELAVRDAKAAGANGFIVVDLPPEEAVGFRKLCTQEGWVVLSR